MAQAPNPTRVSSMSVRPSRALGKEVVIVVFLIAGHEKALRALVDMTRNSPGL
jgi:hypothetical protein